MAASCALDQAEAPGDGFGPREAGARPGQALAIVSAPGRTAATDAHAEVQGQLARLSERLRQIDIREFETQPPALLANGLLPMCLELLEEAGIILHGVVDRLAPASAGSGELVPGAGTEGPGSFEERLDAAVDTRWLPADVAFIATFELRQRRDRLKGLHGGHPPLTLLDECGCALRAIRKALSAVDAAIAEATGRAPRLDFSSVLQSSLRVRRRYATFRSRILATGAPRVEGLHAGLRALGTHLAKLVGWDVYPELRIGDRLQLRELQRRILAWLKAGDRADPADGVRLWEDLVAFVRMMGLISRREELVEHDRGVVSRMWAGLGRLEVEATVPEPLLRVLASLEGLDEAVDGLLLAGERRAGPWRETLAPVRDRFAQGPRGAGAGA